MMAMFCGPSPVLKRAGIGKLTACLDVGLWAGKAAGMTPERTSIEAGEQ
jgi:hypothetical protein